MKTTYIEEVEDDAVYCDLTFAEDALVVLHNKELRFLITSLSHAKASVRLQASRALGGLGQQTTAVSAVLAEVLKNDEDNTVRQAAVVSLSLIGGATEKVVGALSDALLDQDHYVRELSAQVLQDLGGAAQPASKQLIYCLQDPFTDVRANAAWALGATGASSESEEISNALCHSLSDNESIVRWRAAVALGRLGVSTDKVIASLNRALNDRDGFVCEAAQGALVILNGVDQ